MNNEITVSELKKLSADSYMLIDMRDEYAFSYGHIVVQWGGRWNAYIYFHYGY